MRQSLERPAQEVDRGERSTSPLQVAEGDGSVRVLGHHGSKQPTSNSKLDAPQRSWVFEK